MIRMFQCSKTLESPLQLAAGHHRYRSNQSSSSSAQAQLQPFAQSLATDWELGKFHSVNQKKLQQQQGRSFFGVEEKRVKSAPLLLYWTAVMENKFHFFNQLICKYSPTQVIFKPFLIKPPSSSYQFQVSGKSSPSGKVKPQNIISQSSIFPAKLSSSVCSGKFVRCF